MASTPVPLQFKDECLLVTLLVKVVVGVIKGVFPTFLLMIDCCWVSIKEKRSNSGHLLNFILLATLCFCFSHTFFPTVKLRTTASHYVYLVFISISDILTPIR